MKLSSSYYGKYAAAYVRGVFMRPQEIELPCTMPFSLLEKQLDELTADEVEEILEIGKSVGLKLYHFKNTHDELPRVKRVIGFLRSIEMNTLLDVGSGRGAFLWPCLNAFPQLEVMSLDILPNRIDMFNKVKAGGAKNLEAIVGDICCYPANDKSYDVVTMLEVLEHIPDALSAIRAAVRIVQKYVVVSVPAKADNNPEHIHLLTKDVLTNLFNQAGCNRLHFDAVNGHLIVVAAMKQAAEK
jgi:precorrin-6B methylase 2